MSTAPTLTGARRVRDYVVGFRYRASLFRAPVTTGTSGADPSYRFALRVGHGPATASVASDAPILVVTSSQTPDGATDRLTLHAEDHDEALGESSEIRDIEAFVTRAGDLACDHLGVDRGTFRPIAGSEPPAPWETVDPDTSPCLVCGSPTQVGDDHCDSCGTPTS